MKLNDKLYNILKWVCLIAIPAIITFLSAILIPCGVEPTTANLVTLILGAVATLIGSLIGISSANYKEEGDDE